MLNSVFHLKGFHLSSDPVLQEVIHAYSHSSAGRRPQSPLWNVDVVLCHFVYSAFEPLGLISLWLLTQNSLFWFLWLG